MKIHSKLGNFAFYFSSTIILLLISGCAISYGKWTTHDGGKELPYAHGEITEMLYRPRPCPMCPTGNNGQVVLASTQKCHNTINLFRKKYSMKDIFSDAEKILIKALPKDEWTFLRKTFVNTDRYFYPARVFIPSIDPMILIITPWDQYDLNKVKSDNGYITKEADKFYEFESIEKSNRKKHIEIGWPSELHIPIELRRNLPFRPATIRIVSLNFDKTIEIRSEENINFDVEIEKYKINFIENNNKINIFFKNTKHSCQE